MASVDAHAAWNAVLKHDQRYDGRFVYAVSSTHIYCRPSCPSRRPARHRVTFFPSPQQAEAGGFRACLRCRPQSDQGSLQDRRIEQARQYLDAHADETVSLRRLAGHVGLSPFHLQRAFRRSLGLSPKAYQGAKRIERFTALLQRGESVTSGDLRSRLRLQQPCRGTRVKGTRDDAVRLSIRRQRRDAALCHDTRTGRPRADRRNGTRGCLGESGRQ